MNHKLLKEIEQFCNENKEHKIWSEDMVEALKMLYPEVCTKKVTEFINAKFNSKLTQSQVGNKASFLSLKKGL